MAYLTRSQAEALIDRCERDGVRILGVEGFRRDGQRVIPDMDAIADFTVGGRVLSVRDSVKEARRFLSAVAPDLAFDFSLDPDEP